MSAEFLSGQVGNKINKFTSKLISLFIIISLITSNTRTLAVPNLFSLIKISTLEFFL